MNQQGSVGMNKSMRPVVAFWVAIGLLLAGIANPRLVQAQAGSSAGDLTVHEWGTFTSIAGRDGRAIEWRPWPEYTPFSDLPGFVERAWGPLKVGLRGTMRMETPVLYFYSQRAQTVSVRVNFSRGLITEWYPRAVNSAQTEAVDAIALYKKHASSGIAWNAVSLEPEQTAAFPRDEADSTNHYYAARQTAAVPLAVKTGDAVQREKFLFYRGVSTSPMPVTAALTSQGLVVREQQSNEIPAMVLFERRGDRVGYRVLHDPHTEAALSAPELTASLESLYGDLEQILEARGLYQDEAHAMLQTWRNSWFEEGSRLLYIVPPGFVDSILPLTITPGPAKTLRVFLGRMELITPATEKAVSTAMAIDDKATLAKYGRFLEPIMQALKEKAPATQRPSQ